VDAWSPVFAMHDVEMFTIVDRDGERPADMPDWIPTGTDMIRSWGIYKAWASGSKYTLTLDDDVRPIVGCDLLAEYERVFDAGAVCSPFLSVGALTTSDQQMRGFPYAQRKPAPVAVQYGGWNGVLDYDAATQLATNPRAEYFKLVTMPVPRGAAVTTCIMNAAWRSEYAPIMWQLPMLEGRYNRFGDIWSGLFQKRVLDIVGAAMVINGDATVVHERASDPIKNLEREQPGIYYNEILAGAVFDRDMPLEDDRSLSAVYRAVTDWASAIFPGPYRAHFLKARDGWLELFS